MREPKIEREARGGVQRLYEFANGRGASVVRHQYSYGGRDGLWELAILDADGELDYSTPITEDVIGWQNEEQIDELLARIEALPPVAKES